MDLQDPNLNLQDFKYDHETSIWLNDQGYLIFHPDGNEYAESEVFLPNGNAIIGILIGGDNYVVVENLPADQEPTKMAASVFRGVLAVAVELFPEVRPDPVEHLLLFNREQWNHATAEFNHRYMVGRTIHGFYDVRYTIILRDQV